MIEKALAWFYARKGKVSYSMEHRNGPSSYDCSSSVYYALKEAGLLPSSYWIGNTDTLFDALEKNGWVRVPTDANGDAQCQRGDVFIWGIRGNSGGALGHCLPYDNTELLTPTGWRSLIDFKVGDDIIQFDDKTSRLECATVLAVTGPMQDNVYRRGNIEVTDGHRMLVRGISAKEFDVKQWGDIKDKNGYVFPVAKNDSGLVGDIRNLKDDEIKLLLAIQADGSFEGIRVRFHLKKQRKIDELKDILNSLGVKYTVGALEKSGAIRINFHLDSVQHLVKKYLTDKKFNNEWLGISRDQADVIYDNIVLWDGSIKESSRNYSSSIESNVDIIQQALFLNGYRAHKRKDGSMFVLGLQQHENAVHSGKYHLETKGEQTRKTTVGCVTVRSGFIVSRQFGVPTIVGNTGMFVDADNVINCRYQAGIVVDNHDWLWAASGRPPYTFYRFVGKSAPAVQRRVALPEVYYADEVATVFNIRQIRCNRLAYEFSWEDNGIPTAVATKVDRDGYLVGGDINTGDYFRLVGGMHVISEEVENGHKYLQVKMGEENVWVLAERARDIAENDFGTPQPQPRPEPQPAPKTPEPTPQPEQPQQQQPEIPEQPAPTPQPEERPLAPQPTIDDILRGLGVDEKTMGAFRKLLHSIIEFITNLFKKK